MAYLHAPVTRLVRQDPHIEVVAHDARPQLRHDALIRVQQDAHQIPAGEFAGDGAGCLHVDGKGVRARYIGEHFRQRCVRLRAVVFMFTRDYPGQVVEDVLRLCRHQMIRAVPLDGDHPKQLIPGGCGHDDAAGRLLALGDGDSLRLRAHVCKVSVIHPPRRAVRKHDHLSPGSARAQPLHLCAALVIAQHLALEAAHLAQAQPLSVRHHAVDRPLHGLGAGRGGRGLRRLPGRRGGADHRARQDVCPPLIRQNGMLQRQGVCPARSLVHFAARGLQHRLAHASEFGFLWAVYADHVSGTSMVW